MHVRARALSKPSRSRSPVFRPDVEVLEIHAAGPSRSRSSGTTRRNPPLRGGGPRVLDDVGVPPRAGARTGRVQVASVATTSRRTVRSPPARGSAEHWPVRRRGVRVGRSCVMLSHRQNRHAPATALMGHRRRLGRQCHLHLDAVASRTSTPRPGTSRSGAGAGAGAGRPAPTRFRTRPRRGAGPLPPAPVRRRQRGGVPGDHQHRRGIHLASQADRRLCAESVSASTSSEAPPRAGQAAEIAAVTSSGEKVGTPARRAPSARTEPGRATATAACPTPQGLHDRHQRGGAPAARRAGHEEGARAGRDVHDQRRGRVAPDTEPDVDLCRSDRADRLMAAQSTASVAIRRGSASRPGRQRPGAAERARSAAAHRPAPGRTGRGPAERPGPPQALGPGRRGRAAAVRHLLDRHAGKREVRPVRKPSTSGREERSTRPVRQCAHRRRLL
jgi:hypothetical protein